MSVPGKARATGAPFFRLRRGTSISVLRGGLLLFTLTIATPVTAKVRISSLSDVNFGTISNLTIDAVQAQSICIYSNGLSNGYSIRADGSGAGGAFTLSNGVTSMAYTVRWHNQAGQSNGTILTTGALLGAQTTTAQNQLCSSGAPTTASLIVTLPATSLSSAGAGNYSGTLTLIVAEE
jgi:spore coat protein U-like protein